MNEVAFPPSSNDDSIYLGIFPWEHGTWWNKVGHSGTSVEQSGKEGKMSGTLICLTPLEGKCEKEPQVVGCDTIFLQVP